MIANLAKILGWILKGIMSIFAEVYMDNKMTDSQRILKFIEYDVDGDS